MLGGGGAAIRALLAFGFAGAMTLVATPLARRLALATSFLDLPASRKPHARATPYLGGLAIALGLLAGLAVGLFALGTWPPGVAVTAAAAVILLLIGLVDDRWSAPASLRLLVQTGVAVLVIVAGVRIHLSGIAPLDVAVTVLWLVGVTNTVNLVDNMDGLASGTVGASALATAVLGLITGQVVVTVLAAALGGALLAFLAHNLRPARIFMGDAGSGLVGFAIAVAAVEISPQVARPASFLVPLLLLAIPIADTVTVVLQRLRHGRRVALGGTDHLSHRLVASGLSIDRAVRRLVRTQALLAALAVGFGAGRIPLGVTAVAALLLLVSPLVAAWTADVYQQPLGPRARLVERGAAAIAVAALAVAGLLLVRGPTGPRVDVAISDPATGEPVTLRGSGFEPGSTVLAHVRDRVVAESDVGTGGDATLVFTPPQGLSGAVDLTVRGVTAGGAAAHVPVELLLPTGSFPNRDLGVVTAVGTTVVGAAAGGVVVGRRRRRLRVASEA